MSRGWKLAAGYAAIVAVIAVGVYWHPSRAAGTQVAEPRWVQGTSVEDRAAEVYRGFVAANTEAEMEELIRMTRSPDKALERTLQEGLLFLSQFYLQSQGKYPDLEAFKAAARKTYTQLRGAQKQA